VLLKMGAGSSGITFLDPSVVLLLGELMLLVGSSARMECNLIQFDLISLDLIFEFSFVRNGCKFG